MELQPPCDLGVTSFEIACNKLGIEPHEALIFAPETLREVVEKIVRFHHCDAKLVSVEMFHNPACWAVLPPEYVEDCVTSTPAWLRP